MISIRLEADGVEAWRDLQQATKTRPLAYRRNQAIIDFMRDLTVSFSQGSEVDHTSITESIEYENEIVRFGPIPDHKAPWGIYTGEMAGSVDFGRLQYAVFSSMEVAKKSLKMIDPTKPVLYAVVSRIKKTEVLRFQSFLFAVVEKLQTLGVTALVLELGALDLTRLVRSYSSFAVLLNFFEYAAENGIAVKPLGIDMSIAVITDWLTVRIKCKLKRDF